MIFSQSKLYPVPEINLSLDLKNPNNLERLIPTFIRDNSSNVEYSLFYNMIGKHFDLIWTSKITKNRPGAFQNRFLSKF